MLIGYLSDKMNPWNLGSIILLATSVSTFVLWGVLSYTLAGLLSFSIVYGFVASGWVCVFTAFIDKVSGASTSFHSMITNIAELFVSRRYEYLNFIVRISVALKGYWKHSFFADLIGINQWYAAGRRRVIVWIQCR